MNVDGDMGVGEQHFLELGPCLVAREQEAIEDRGFLQSEWRQGQRCLSGELVINLVSQFRWKPKK